MEDRPKKTKVMVRVFGPRPFEEGKTFDHSHPNLEDIIPMEVGGKLWFVCKYRYQDI